MAQKNITTEAEAETTRAEAQALEKQKALVDLRWILNTPHGIRFFRRLARKARPFGTDYCNDSRDHAFYSGNRNALLEILAEVSAADPSKLPLIMFEGSDSDLIASINQKKE